MITGYLLHILCLIGRIRCKFLEEDELSHEIPRKLFDVLLTSVAPLSKQSALNLASTL